MKNVHLESRDVSAGGLSFSTSRRIPLDAESRVVIARLGDLGQPALIHARVAYRQHDPESGRYTVGLEFTRFVNTSREELASRIDSWSQSTPTPPA